MSLMFKKLDKQGRGIQIIEGDTIRYICDISVALAFESLWEMISWEYKSFVRDAKVTKVTPKDKAYWVWSNFFQRSTARTFSYINLTCNLEGILKRLYVNELIPIANQLFKTSTFKVDEQELTKRENEVAIFYNYRNKVCAHTAYANPRRDDDLIQKYKSILCIAGACRVPKDNLHFSIGGQGFNQKPEHKLNQYFSMYEQHPTLINHFQRWDDMFAKLLIQIRNCCPYEVPGKYKIFVYSPIPPKKPKDFNEAN